MLSTYIQGHSARPGIPVVIAECTTSTTTPVPIAIRGGLTGSPPVLPFSWAPL
jgi:hypothetical protein